MQTATHLERINLAEAARRLGCSTRTVERLIHLEIFTMFRDGFGDRLQRFFYADEVELYLQLIPKGQLVARAAVKEFRRENDRL